MAYCSLASKQACKKLLTYLQQSHPPTATGTYENAISVGGGCYCTATAVHDLIDFYLQNTLHRMYFSGKIIKQDVNQVFLKPFCKP